MFLIAINASVEQSNKALNGIPILRDAIVVRIEAPIGGIDIISVPASDLRHVEDDVDRNDRYRSRYRHYTREDRRDIHEVVEEALEITTGGVQLLATHILNLSQGETVLIITDKFNVAAGNREHISDMFEATMDTYVNSHRERGVIVSTSEKLVKPVKAERQSTLIID